MLLRITIDLSHPTIIADGRRPCDAAADLLHSYASSLRGIEGGPEGFAANMGGLSAAIEQGREVPKDATAATVVARIGNQHLQATRFYPPGHAKYGPDQEELIAEDYIEIVGDHEWCNALSGAHIEPGDWLVVHDPDGDPPEYLVYTDAEFREKFCLPS